MEKISLYCALTNRNFTGYIYADNIVLVRADSVPDSGSLVIEDAHGYRYKRKIRQEAANSYLYEFHKI